MISCRGYLKNPQATADAWRGGWFHTGDVARQDQTGMLFFVDRNKNIIRRSGENIAAAEVEATLLGHEAVAEVAVMAAADEVRELTPPGRASRAAPPVSSFLIAMPKLDQYPFLFRPSPLTVIN